MPSVPLSTVAIRLRPIDNVAIASKPLPQGTVLDLDGREITLPGPVKMGHKFAVVPITEDEPIRKYGQIIGFASKDVPLGGHVHVHNVKLGAFERDYAFCTETPKPQGPPAEERFWMGFDRGTDRPDHLRYGTRNYVAVISTVNCSASASKYITDRIRASGVLNEFDNVDGVVPIVHKQGCAMAYDGSDHHQLNRTLAGIARHPNVAAYILVGLGCETGQAIHLIENEGLELIQIGGPKKKPLVINIQDAGGISKTVEAGVRGDGRFTTPGEHDPADEDFGEAHHIGHELRRLRRQLGRHGQPGARRRLGHDRPTGGTSILGETPEIYGAEHLLTRRAVSREVGEKLVERIKWWEWYTGIFGAEINNNPSPGNKEGGLTTIYEKSLGAIAKAGSTAMTDVVHYAEPVTAKGFVVMDTPGYDPVSMTGIAAGGANVLVFTTGRGSVFGCKPVPSIKVATNTPLYNHMLDDMDINAGKVLSGSTVEEVGREIFEKILSVASGEKTKSEITGVGEEEFAPWSIGPTL